MKISDVMCTNVACCRTDTPLKEVARMMVECDCGAIPVIDDAGGPIGLITDRDITCRALAQGRNPLELTAADCMTSPVLTATPDESLAECCERLEENQIRRVPVVDERGRCVGIVSLADVARHASKRSTAEVVRRVSEPSLRGRASAVAP